jgi:hypothetical protein
MSNLKLIELAVFCGLPLWAFFDKRNATTIWRLWFGAIVVIFVFAFLGV